VEETFWTKPNGHRISLYYTLIIMTAVGFLLIPLDLFGASLKWAVALGMPVLAVLLTLFARLFARHGIQRCRISENSETGARGFHVGNISVSMDEITKIIRISRQSLFGSELQVYTDKIIPATIIVLEELRNPGDLIEALRKDAPRAVYKESVSGMHPLDWGLWISLAALAIIAISKVF
jgi:hypothetical protein